MPSEESTAGADRHFGRVVDELKRELETKSRELGEAREQQAATAGILAAISSSPADLRRVFAEIAANAARLCDASNVSIGQVDGASLRIVAHHGPLPTTGQATQPLTRGLAFARAVLDRQAIHVADLQAEMGEYPQSTDLARRLGIRTVLVQPLIRDGKAIGAISIRRAEVRPFTDRQIELLKTFADQAVIAIENTRLFETEQARTRELQRALDQQAATSKILSVISGSPGELEPVFETILRSARQLCGAEFGHLLLFDGETWRAAALHNLPKPYADWWNHAPVIAGPETNLGRVQRTGRPDQVADVRVGKGYISRTPLGIATAELGGARTLLSVPLLKEGAVIGCLSLYRTEVRPFDHGQIELLASFADQAVIAIENTRLCEELQARTKELQESLDRRTATSEVLGVISRSPNEVQPVLDTIVATAHRLCQSERTVIWRLEDETFRAVAHCGQPEELVESVYSARLP